MKAYYHHKSDWQFVVFVAENLFESQSNAHCQLDTTSTALPPRPFSPTYQAWPIRIFIQKGNVYTCVCVWECVLCVACIHVNLSRRWF